MAKKVNGVWLSIEDVLDEDVSMLKTGETAASIEAFMDQEMSPAGSVEAYFDDQTPKINAIHVLIGIPQKQNETTKAAKAPETLRKERWDKLNVILEGVEQVDADREHSSLDMDMLSGVYEPIQPFPLPVKEVPHETISSIQQCIGLEMESTVGSVLAFRTAVQRLVLTKPIIFHVVQLFQEDDPPAKILVAQDLRGNNVRATSHLDLALTRDSKTFSFVMAEDDVNQGMAQAIVGMEVASDLGDMPVVYGIATNYVQWFFSKRSDDSVQMSFAFLDFDPNRSIVEENRRKDLLSSFQR